MKKEKVIRISRANRLMAIKRLHEFKNDHNDFLNIKRSGKEQLIINKMVDLEKKWGEPLYAIENAEEIYYDITNKGKTSYFCIRVVRMIEKDPIITFTSGGVSKDDISEVTGWHLTGDRLYLEVDILNATKRDLKKDFKRIIDQYDDFLPAKRKSRDKQSNLDHWKVWDMYHDEKKSLLVITKALFYKKKLSGTRANPSYNKSLMKKYKKTQRAHKKAKSIIESIRSSLSLPLL